MNRLHKQKKGISLFLLFCIGINIAYPTASYALTSGPAQPEGQGFQEAGVADMVDTFTGSFKYNIPLVDIDGYPINLNYQSGIGMDDEASWTGLGWNVNIGAINRQLRGVPDDFAGDNFETEHYTKPKVTIGGTVRVKGELKGAEKFGAKGGVSLSLGIFNDNYTGIGAELGANAGVNFSFSNDGLLTGGLGVGISSNTAEGVNVSPYANFSIYNNSITNMTANAGLSGSLSYNTRSGIKGLTLGSSFGAGVNNNNARSIFSSTGSTISFNTEPVNPKIQVPYNSKHSSFSVAVGVAGFLLFGGVEGSGYKTVKEVQSKGLSNPAYGFLYAEKGKSQPNAMMDFIREKENPVIPELPNLAIPVQTPDVFSYTSQVGMGQFRVYRGGTGAFFDNEVIEKGKTETAGLDAGGGLIAHGGLTFFEQHTENSTRKWRNGNAYLDKGDFQDAPQTVGDLSKEHAYFKQVGEKTPVDVSLNNKLQGTQPLAVKVYNEGAKSEFTNAAITSPIKKEQREIKVTNISYLTAKEAALSGLEKKIKSYPFNDLSNFQPISFSGLNAIKSSRITTDRKPHHLSEMTVTKENGSRMIYGLPVYNLSQREYSYAVGKKSYSGLLNQNQVSVSGASTTDNNALSVPPAGIDNYYHKESVPAYATSFLLTAILSPDYVDKTGDGISDDDLGTGMKFNYSKSSTNFRWRTPYQNATLNKGLLADADDDKASIVYGEKELWYAHSIESKTKVLYFITKDRDDALGVKNLLGGKDVSQKQKLLSEIRLYSKTDPRKPIKTVKFEYDYSLCPNVPNNVNAGAGKLTLKKVYFIYGNSDKGKNRAYVFSYNEKVNGQTVAYGYMQTDRWGTYKPLNSNPGFTLNNEEFPYTAQDAGWEAGGTARNNLDQYASLWNLSKIELPTGGIIDVTYESNDYAYVQNKKAMAMVKPGQLFTNQEVAASGDSYTVTSSLAAAHGFKLQLPETIPEAYNRTISEKTRWFKQNYLDGSDYIYTKFSVFIANSNSKSGGPDYNYDFNPCYAKIKAVDVRGSEANIILEDRTDEASNGTVTANPIVFSAWQRIKNEYPRYAYPAFDRRTSDNNAAKAYITAIKAIFSAARNLSELTQNFYEKARDKAYAKDYQAEKSFVRITKANGFKLGGGARVKKIRISDKWKSMNNDDANISEAAYGQCFEYTTVEDGKTISSGVATYEPTIGSDENPLRQPVPYIQRIKGTVGNYFNLEEPFGESFYPSPTVGYRRVTTYNLNKDGEKDVENNTGFSTDEFYTAKEFPARVKVMPIDRLTPNPRTRYSILSTDTYERAIYSQGYSIELNDMHGKPKANRIYNKAGAEISSTVYYYKAESVNGDELRLTNKVDIIDQNGNLLPNQVIGRDMEFFTDVREQESLNQGTSITPGFDVFPIAFWIVIWPHSILNNNTEQKVFNSVCGVKVSEFYGIVDKVVKRVNGSEITTQNIAFDGITGEALVTRTQNEFKRDIYSVNLPAYWVYKGMGPAYQNLGMLLQGLTTDAGGQIPASYAGYLQAGDMLADINATEGTDNVYWVINNASGTAKLLIDRNGNIKANVSTAFKVVRSGFYNMLDASTSNIVCLNNPIQNNQLRLALNADLTDLRVINAATTTYSSSWAVQPECPQYESVDYCFTFGVGKSNVVYNEEGTDILQSPGGETTNIKSWLWGGVQSGETGGISNRRLDSVPTAKMLATAAVLGCDKVELQCNPTRTADPSGLYNNNWPINRAGIWNMTSFDANLNEVMGFEAAIDAPSTKTYYLGYGGDNNISIYIDNQPVVTNATNYNRWKIIPITINAGSHVIRAEFYNRCVEGQNNAGNPAVAAIELYNNTFSQLSAANDLSDLNILFSTASLRNNSAVKSFRTINGTRIWNRVGMVVTNTPFLYFIPFTFSGNEQFIVANTSGETITNPYFNSKTFFDKVSVLPSLSDGSVPDTLYNSKYIDVCLNLETVHDLTLAYSRGVAVYLDGELWNLAYSSNNTDPPNRWLIDFMFKRHSVKAGRHTLRIFFNNNDSPPDPLFPNWKGVEIYSNTEEQIINVDAYGSDLDVIFSTEWIRNKTDVNTSYRKNGVQKYHYRFSNGEPFVECQMNSVFRPETRNPYVAGYLSNWRPYQTKVFQQNRNYGNVYSATNQSVGVATAGYLQNFWAYWFNNASTWSTNTSGTRNKWINSNTVTLYDKYGQQLENQDALGRYSAAKFDFRGELPGAVASNAMWREIYANGFEDATLNSSTSSTCGLVEFTGIPGVGNSYAHSGRYSIMLGQQPLALNTSVHEKTQKTEAYLDRKSTGEYITRDVRGLYPMGFEPVNGKKYVFNAWVKDGMVNTTVPVTLKMSVDGVSPTTVNLTCKAVVEGWKLVEGTLDLGTLSAADKLQLELSGFGVYVDDIRIHPYDAQMKTYAYDDRNLRLMAELDENCFATFYEYDDEGGLVRVKKETERGIMTIKETRSSQRRKP